MRPLVQGFTVDGPDSTDLDDAVWTERTKTGYRVHVSIADVAYFVAPGSDLDDAARARAFTRYHAHGRVPMIPTHISEDAASLLEGELRPVVTVSIPIDFENRNPAPLIHRAVLRSQKKLAHQHVPEILADHRHALHEQVSDCVHVAYLLWRRRHPDTAIVNANGQTAILTTEEGTLVRPANVDAVIGHFMVQEFMIYANCAIARYMDEAGLGGIFRNHRTRVQRAHYSAESSGHYGLGVPNYTHFTSPIRRFPDLVAHRLVLAALEGGQRPYTQDEIERICQHTNWTELELTGEAKKRASAASKKAILAKPRNELNACQLHVVIKEALETGDVSQSLLEFLLKKLHDDELTHSQLSTICFVKTPKSERITKLQWAVLKWLRKYPKHTRLIFRAGRDAGVVAMPVMCKRVLNNKTRQITANGISHHGLPVEIVCEGKNSRMTLRQAYLDVLTAIIGVRSESLPPLGLR